MTWSPEARRFMKVVVPSVIISSLILLAGSGCSQPSLTVEATATTLPPPGQPTLTVPATEVPTAVPTATSTPRPTTEVQVGGGAGGVAPTAEVKPTVAPTATEVKTFVENGKVKAEVPLKVPKKTLDSGLTHMEGYPFDLKTGIFKTGEITKLPETQGIGRGTFSAVVAGKPILDKTTGDTLLPLVMDSKNGPIVIYWNMTDKVQPGMTYRDQNGKDIPVEFGNQQEFGFGFSEMPGDWVAKKGFWTNVTTEQVLDKFQPGRQLVIEFWGNGDFLLACNTNKACKNIKVPIGQKYGPDNQKLIDGQRQFKTNDILRSISQVTLAVPEK